MTYHKLCADPACDNRLCTGRQPRYPEQAKFDYRKYCTMCGRDAWLYQTEAQTRAMMLKGLGRCATCQGMLLIEREATAARPAYDLKLPNPSGIVPAKVNTVERDDAGKMIGTKTTWVTLGRNKS